MYSYAISCENDSSLVTSYQATAEIWMGWPVKTGPQKFWAHELREAKDDEADDKEDADDKDKAKGSIGSSHYPFLMFFFKVINIDFIHCIHTY